jgi:poly(A) polymerase
MSALVVSTTVAIPSWMNETVLKLLHMINGEAEIPRALMVGGAVRDTVLEKPVSDFDIATTLTPDELISLMDQNGVKTIPTGIDHGTVTVLLDDEEFQITTLRKDLETDGRHAVVSFTQDWEEDARRRDFTMNTLLMNEKGEVFDPLGTGLDDLSAGRLIFVGDPEQRIQEDYLRILRYFRFFAYYGLGDADQDALYACADHREGLKSLSKERVTAEIFKMLQAPQAMKALKLMFSCDILTGLKGSSFDEDLFSQLADWHRRHNLNDLSARLVVLAGFKKEHIKRYKDYLLLSKRQEKDVYMMLGSFYVLTDLSDKTVKTSVYHFGGACTVRTLMLIAAIAGKDLKSVGKHIALVQSWQPPDSPITSKDLEAEHVEKGPMFGKVLRAFEAWWIENDFTTDRDQSLIALKEIAASV